MSGNQTDKQTNRNRLYRRGLRWATLAAVSSGSLFGFNCSDALMDSIKNGTLTYVTGQVSGSIGVFGIQMTDLISGILTGQPLFGGAT